MISYIARRFLWMIVVILIVSVVSFIIINLPPGDFLDSYLTQLTMEGGEIRIEMVEGLRHQYGLDLPLSLRYFKWMAGILRGDLGRSLLYKRPVVDLLIERVPLTIIISLLSTVFVFVVAIPIGIYSAIKQYSVGDYSFTVIGFFGLATPNFLLALILMYLFYTYFGISIGGLFSYEYVRESWSLAKFIDMVNHLWAPIIVIGTASTAGLIRVIRGCLLDELQKQYVITARAKGLGETRLLFKYPVRMALNPVFSTLGWLLPAIVSGETITAIVLNLPTTGPLIYSALMSQDMFLAGSTVMFLTILTVIGTFLSDLLLVWADPRIRYYKRSS